MDVEGIRTSMAESARVLDRLASETAPAVAAAGQALGRCVRDGGKILLCGNGGSAADAQHVATELVVRYLADRPAIPAIALTVDSSILTAASNDLGFEQAFARQVEALGERGDALVAISTSGTSPNVLAAARTARDRGLVTVGLTGADGGTLKESVDHWIGVPSDHTPRIQEAHLVVEHLLCEIVERSASGSGA
ncbi:MAG TPA: SIS domain-containing protein [bacterium]|nr:SIS domain-containing protein [bacterium]